MYLIDRQIAFFSLVHGNFSKTDHTIGHKTNLNNFKTNNSVHIDRSKWNKIRH